MQTLLKSTESNVVLVHENTDAKVAVSTFDHRDLNAYLLVVVGLAKPSEDDAKLYDDIVQKAKAREAIPLRDIQPLLRKNEIVTLPVTATLDKAVEYFGSGTHRILVTSEEGAVVGILSQSRLVEFFWNEAVNFPSIDKLYNANLRDLSIGSQRIIAVKSVHLSGS
jgi:CBS domain-containing protein